MISANIYGVEFISVNTDIQHLEASLAPTRIQIGEDLTRGLGAGSDPAIGRHAALESRDVLSGYIDGADMIFITAGMGGGTGTGAAPVIAGIAKELGILTVAIVTKPFFFEGRKRAMNAEEGLHELRQSVNTMIVIPNDRISLVVERGTSLLQSFATVNDVLRQAVQGISDLVLVPGLINLDFADIRSIMQRAGRAVIGMGTGRGTGGAFEAARKSILNPLLEKSSIEGAKGILINITGGLNISLDEIQEAASLIHDNSHEDANIILGAVIDPSMKDDIRVTVIATGIDERQESLDLPETKVWKPKIDAAPLRGTSSILSKNVDMVSGRIAQGAEERQDEKAEARPSETVHAQPQVIQPVAEKKEIIEKIREQPPVTHTGTQIAGADIQADQVESGHLSAYDMLNSDMNVSTIPAEDQYDIPTFLRKRI
jgi:cell division protein FtsZ